MASGFDGMTDAAVVETAVQAVAALYGTNAAARAEANSWLVALAASPRAWAAAAVLLAHAQAEVRHFGANMLLGKCRTDWAGLPADAQAGLRAQLWEQASGGAEADLRASPGGALSMLTRRLCIVLGAAAAAGGAESAAACAQQALGAAAGSGAAAALSLELLVALAEEVDRLDRARRPAVCTALAGGADPVLQLVQAAIADGGDRAHRACALLAAWCKLDPNEGELSLLSAAQLGSKAPALLNALLGALRAADPGAVSSAADALVELYKPGSGTTMAPAPAGAETAAFAAATEAILAQRASATGADADEDVTRSVCRLAVVLAESAPELCAAGLHNSVALAEMLVECLNSRRDAFATEQAAEYFCMLNTVPKVSRHASLQEAAFEALLKATLRQVAYPSGFVDWEDDIGEAADDEDEDSFHRFREQVMADLFGNVCAVLGAGRFLAIVGGALEEGERAGDWQQVEAAVYVVRTSASVLKQCAMSARPSEAGAPGVAAARAAVNGFLGGGVLGRLNPPAPALASNALIVTQVARLVGEYAPWLGNGESVGATREMCVGSLHYVIEGLKVPQARAHAAVAFQKVCARCTGVLAAGEIVVGLVGAGLAAVATDAPVEDRVPVVEGLARVVAALPHAEAAPAAANLAGSLAARVAQAAKQLPSDPTGAGMVAEALAGELELLAAALRFLEQRTGAPPGTPHPAMSALEAAWAALNEVSNSPASKALPKVMGALCSVFKRAISSAGQAVGPVLVPMLEGAVGAFEACQAMEALEVLTAAMETFGSGANTVSGLAAPLGRALSSALPFSTATSPEIIGAVFDLAHRALLFAPAALFSSNAFQVSAMRPCAERALESHARC